MIRTSQRDSMMTIGGAGRCLLVSLVVLSQTALPAMGERPVIRFQPRETTATLLQQAAIAVIADGTAPLRYQWYKDSLPVPGATNDQIGFPHARFSDAGRYSVIVSNGEGIVTSTAVRLTVLAPGPGSLDASFTGGDEPIHSVMAVAFQPDGKMLIADGSVRRLNQDGSTDHTFRSAAFESLDATITAVAVQGDGKVLVGGYQVYPVPFDPCSGTIAAAKVWRLNPDGSPDAGFSSESPGGGPPPQAVRVASRTGPRLHENCGMSSEAAAPVHSVVVQNDGRLLVGGSFSSFQGHAQSSFNLARLNSDGTPDRTFQTELSGANEAIYSIALQADGKVLIGGEFTEVHGVRCGGIARLHSDGTLDNSFIGGVYINESTSSYVHSITVQDDGRALIGGFFRAVNGVPRGGIARLNADGSLDRGFLEGLSGAFHPVYGAGMVHAISVQADHKVLVAGNFASVNDATRNKVARLNADGTLDTTYQHELAGVGGGHSIYVDSIVVGEDLKAVIAGNFASVNGALRRGIARLNTDGTLDDGLRIPPLVFGGDAGPSVQSPCLEPAISALAVQKDGKVVVGGYFRSARGADRSNLARLQSDGSLDGAFLSGQAGLRDYEGYCGVPPPVHAIVIQDDDRLIIGGRFRSVHGVSRNGIARVHADGTLDVGFLNGLSGVSGEPHSFGTVFAAGLQSDGRVIIAGSFTSVNSAPRTNIARLHPDGSLDTAFQDGRQGVSFPGGGAVVHSVVVQNDGKTILGGSFSTVNGATRNCIARLNADGSLDGSFQAGLTGTLGGLGYGPVDAVTLQEDARIVIGGSFQRVNSEMRHGLARLDSNGRLDAAFAASELLEGSAVSSLAIERDGRILVGGWLRMPGNAIPCAIVRLKPDGSRDQSFSVGVLGSVGSIALQRDGSVVIAGGFSRVNGVPVPGIARLWGTADLQPRITSLQRDRFGTHLTWDALPGREYRVQFTRDLSAPDWADLPGETPGSVQGIGTKGDPVANDTSRRFYRVQLLR